MGEPQPRTGAGGALPRAEAEASIWLTAGEAADAAGVSHRQLDAWIAAEKLHFRTGWRGAAEIRLVSLADLRELAGRVDFEKIRSSLSERGVFTGPRHVRLGAHTVDAAAALPGASDEAVKGLEAAVSRLPIRDQDWAVELTREVARLRGVIATLREERDSLERYLDERVDVVRTRRLGASSVSADGGAPVARNRRGDSASSGASHPDRRAADRTGSDIAEGGRARHQGFGWTAIATGLLLGWLGGWAVRAVGALSYDAAEAGVVQASFEARNSAQGSLSSAAASTSVPGSHVAAASHRIPDPASEFTPEEDASQAAVAALEGLAALQLDSGIGSVAAGRALDSAGQVTSASSGAAASLSSASPSRGSPSGAPDANAANDPEGGTADGVLRPRRLRAGMHLAEVDSRAFSSAQRVLDPCAYEALLRAGGAGGLARLALGPCYGAGSISENGEVAEVPGSHRVGDVACCRHHAFVERMTHAASDAAALAGLREEASASLAEQFLPPLLRLRAERAAGRFLRHETGGWESAGLDGVAAEHAEPGHEHAWTFVDTPGEAVDGSEPIVVRLDSWVRLRPGSGPEATRAARPFTMTLTLQASERGDRLDSFAWATED